MTNPSDPTLLSATTPAGDEAYCSACNKSYPAETKVCPTDGARLVQLAAERDDLLGKILEERYEIRAPLGKGGMGTVYRGWQLSVDREVAIKVIHPKLSNDRSAVKRFLREARLASRLSQPNIVNVYDFGQSGGVLYLVTELLRGTTLAQVLAGTGRMPPKRAIGIASQLCDALDAAHGQGIVHRDLKPSNIVILDEPPGRDLLKVLDFGLAKSLVQDSGSLVTHSDALLGTPLYMAPEQIEANESDQRADLYSLGCILHEMLSGRPPFVDAAVSAVLARHVHDAPPTLGAEVPRELRLLVRMLLEKKPEARVQTAAEVRHKLERAKTSPLVDDGAPDLAFKATGVDAIQSSDALARTEASTPVPESKRPDAASVSTSSSAGGTAAALSEMNRHRPRALFWILGAIVVAGIVVLALVMSLNLRPGRENDSSEAAGSDATRPRSGSDGAGSASQNAQPGRAAQLVDAGIQEALSVALDAGVRATQRPRPHRPGSAQNTGANPPSMPPTATSVRDAGTDEMPELNFLRDAGSRAH
jgi:serine/threonine protein kinase